MTTAHCWAVFKSSVVLMAGSSAPPLKQVMNYSKCCISSWESGSKWAPFLSDAFLWHQIEPDIKWRFVVENDRISSVESQRNGLIFLTE